MSIFLCAVFPLSLRSGHRKVMASLCTTVLCAGDNIIDKKASR